MNMPKASDKGGRHSMLLIAGAIGIVLFWRGVWALADITPIIENPWISLTAGLVLLVVSHNIYREL